MRGTVKEVDARGAIIDLGNGVEGQLRASELGRDRVEDARTVLKEGEEIEAKFTGVDRKSRTISLSIKAKEMHEEAEAVQSYRSSEQSSQRHEPRRSPQGEDRRRRTGRRAETGRTEQHCASPAEARERRGRGCHCMALAGPKGET